MSFTLVIRRSAQKSLDRIAQPFQDRIIEAIYALARSPRPAGSKMLRGRDAWRIRVSDYRVIYQIQDSRLIIEIVAVGHRRDIYD